MVSCDRGGSLFVNDFLGLIIEPVSFENVQLLILVIQIELLKKNPLKIQRILANNRSFF
jgi:hypothetical protein